MNGARTMELARPFPLLGGPHGIPVSLESLRRGLATFLWASSRSMSFLHYRAASSIRSIEAKERAKDGAGFQLVGSFVQFLFERQGMERLRLFFRRAERLGIESAARGTFGKGFFELELEWESMLDGYPK